VGYQFIQPEQQVAIDLAGVQVPLETKVFDSQGQVKENCPPACSTYSILWVTYILKHGFDTVWSAGICQLLHS